MVDTMTPTQLITSFQHVYVCLHKKDTPKPRLTFCYIVHPTEPKTYVGVSICTAVDNPIKEDGRNRAHERAKEALFTRESSGFIAKQEALEILYAAAPHLLFIPTCKSLVIPIQSFRFAYRG